MRNKLFCIFVREEWFKIETEELSLIEKGTLAMVTHSNCGYALSLSPDSDHTLAPTLVTH